MKRFDAHFHIINPEFPLVKNQGYLPPAFTIEDYISATNNYHIIGGTVVSGSFQAFDQQYLMDALKKLGYHFYGVANISADTTAPELERLDKAGVVAVRFNLKRGGSEKAEHMERLSNDLFDKYGWHTELYVDSQYLNGLKSVLNHIPRFSIDHLGLSSKGLDQLYYWVEKGIKVKASGFGRIDFDPIPVMKTIYKINPDALMFGTDLPSTRAKVPFSESDIQRIEDHFLPDELENIFFNNGMKWYSKE